MRQPANLARRFGYERAINRDFVLNETASVFYDYRRVFADKKKL